MKMTNILQYLEATAPLYPDKAAFSDGENTLTFAQFADQSAAIGSFLAHQGLYSKPIVVFMKKSPQTIAAFFGAVYAGCYYVPLDEEMPRYRIDLILKALHGGAMICDDATAELAAQLDYSGSIYRYAQIAQTPADREALQAIRAKQLDIDPIYIVFTSGSTGVPKGVMACHRSVIDYIEGLCQVLKFDADTVFGNQTPLYFDACLKEIIPTLKYGATAYLIPKKLFMFPIQLVEYLNQYHINTLCWVVSALTMISSFHTFDTVKPLYLRTIAFASEVFPIKQFNLWRTALPQTRFINLYGPTEATGVCCYYEADRLFDEGEVIPAGKPLPNTEILLLDGQGRLAAPGDEGEICIRGTRLTLGYYRNPEKTAEAFVQNPLNDIYPELIYRTGDIGKYDSHGELLFVGRKDQQIKHMGHRIELGEIEAVVNSHDDVDTACCIYDTQGKKIVLFFTGALSAAELTAYMRKKLPRYMMPNSTRRLDTMPHTANGKIDRNLLKSSCRP